MAELDREKVLDNVMLDLEISKDNDDSIDLLRVLLNRVISHYYDNENEFKPYDDMLQRTFGTSGQSKEGSVLFL